MQNTRGHPTFETKESRPVSLYFTFKLILDKMLLILEWLPLYEDFYFPLYQTGTFAWRGEILPLAHQLLATGKMTF